MKTAWIIGISASIFFLIIVIWQIEYLDNLKVERQTIQNLTSQKLLDESMPILRVNTSIGNNLAALKTECESWENESVEFSEILDSIYYDSGVKFDWAFWRKDRDTVLVSSNKSIAIENWKEADLQKCFSCFLIVTFPDAIDREGMLMSHSVSEMTTLGWEQEDLVYLSILPTDTQNGLKLSDISVLLVILLLGLTLGVVLYINSRQKELIHQKQEFINHLSHQFKTPLASIKLGIKMMIAEPNANHSKLIQLINIESNRLEKHVQTVLQWLKSDARNFEVEKKTLNLVTLTSSVIEQLRPLFQENDTNCILISEQEEILVSGDEYHLSLLLFNLIENSISHNEKGISINIDILKKDDISISISDNGKGFDVKEARSSSRSLGLVYAYKVMDSHGGELILESSIGQGAKASLVFDPNSNE